MSVVGCVHFTDYPESVPRVLDLIGADLLLPSDRLIVIKPNLTNSSSPPVTTHVQMVEAVLQYCRDHRPAARVVVGEGSGGCETHKAYSSNGYDKLAERYGVELLDFNTDETVCVRRADALSRKKFYLPKVLTDAFVISVPVLKDHSMTTMTASLKNMFGIAPKAHYKLAWNKAKLHWPSTHKSVVDVCLYKKPELSVIDASVVLTGQHLSGTPKNVGCIPAGADPVATDAVAARLLGHEPSDIKYLTLADGLLGTKEDIELVGDGLSQLARSKGA